MKRIAWLAAAGVTALVVATPAFAQAPKLEKPHIALSVGGEISQMNKIAYFVALNKKYLEQEGLTVDSTAFASGTAALQNLIGGNADVVEGSFEHTLRMQTKGQNLMCIAVFGRYPANVLVVRKSEAGKIKTVADLSGKKIGISAPGASTHNFVAGLMERAGVNYKDASYVSVGTGLSAVAAMQWLKIASIDEIIRSLAKDYYQADEKLYRKSLEKNLAAFQWDGIVSGDAVRNVWKSISILEPELKDAKVDYEKTYDNAIVEKALAKWKAPLAQ